MSDYVPWDAAEVMKRLREAGCKCHEDPTAPSFKMPSGRLVTIHPGISMDSCATAGDPMSYRAVHACKGCCTRIYESAVPIVPVRDRVCEVLPTIIEVNPEAEREFLEILDEKIKTEIN